MLISKLTQNQEKILIKKYVQPTVIQFFV